MSTATDYHKRKRDIVKGGDPNDTFRIQGMFLPFWLAEALKRINLDIVEEAHHQLEAHQKPHPTGRVLLIRAILVEWTRLGIDIVSGLRIERPDGIEDALNVRIGREMAKIKRWDEIIVMLNALGCGLSTDSTADEVKTALRKLIVR